MQIIQAASILVALTAAPVVAGNRFFSPGSSLAIRNSCTFNIHVWRQTDKLEKLPVIGPNITMSATWEPQQRAQRVSYIFSREEKPKTERVFLNYLSKSSKDKIGGNAHLYSDLKNPFEGTRASLSMSAARIGTVSTSAAAAAGMRIGAWVSRKENEDDDFVENNEFVSFGAESIALGAEFCSSAGEQIEWLMGATSEDSWEVLNAMEEKTFSDKGLMEIKGNAI
ncbi:hypothetical protein VHEMI06135 [[Torrubiella] hemipterigena]|uniref:Uncharacterized protein n=1 Tax=[Torrubiella] hemipterigena TaxID=1531966 RepID=A0A0A1T6A1_9HYPO|nr:hypothetical protein VHEMI06135 [[Torrubiella] hemipterigena]